MLGTRQPATMFWLLLFGNKIDSLKCKLLSALLISDAMTYCTVKLNEWKLVKHQLLSNSSLKHCNSVRDTVLISVRWWYVWQHLEMHDCQKPKLPQLHLNEPLANESTLKYLKISTVHMHVEIHSGSVAKTVGLSVNGAFQKYVFKCIIVQTLVLYSWFEVWKNYRNHLSWFGVVQWVARWCFFLDHLYILLLLEHG